METLSQTVGFFALTPWWFRLLMFLGCVGWSLATYQGHRDAGDDRPLALGKTLIAPVTAIVRLALDVLELLKPKPAGPVK